MSKETQEKTRLHARNRNREPYDLAALIAVEPELQQYIKPNKHGADSIDFADAKAVKLLNKALLHHYYGVTNWNFPDENLCPPIPGRADYLHYMADLLGQSNFGTVPTGEKITVLDIGVGASSIYPIIGVTEYGWNFIGSDINEKSLASAQKIIDANTALQNKVSLRLQQDDNSIFKGILREDEMVDFTMCNPPFHVSEEEAQKGAARKVKNLSGKKTENPALNFAGINKELICEGGESSFIKNMIAESKSFRQNCYWFSTLVSKKSNLKAIYKLLNAEEAVQVKTISLGTGNKSSHIIAWSFLTKAEQQDWKNRNWND